MHMYMHMYMHVNENSCHFVVMYPIVLVKVCVYRLWLVHVASGGCREENNLRICMCMFYTQYALYMYLSLALFSGSPLVQNY